MRITQISTQDSGGGAERVAWSLFQEYREQGHESRMVVGRKLSSDPDVHPLPEECPRGAWSRGLHRLERRARALHGRVPGAGRAAGLLHEWSNARRGMDHLLGREDFHFPASHALLEAAREGGILHAHNLHGGYFDLRLLPALSAAAPLLLTLHDAWLLSGHCAHSFGCERWKTGCGRCPDLAIEPAIRRDATAANWTRKRDIYARSRLYVATPCRWLLEKVEQSMLAPAVVEERVIPNGVDLSIFHPAPREEARAALGLPAEGHILLFAANGIRRNMWKDYATLRGAVERLADNGEDILFLALGEDAPAERIGRAEIRFIPHQPDTALVARYYQAADLYLHAARADTFPTTVLEALACGTPVVATAVGGIPEQVVGLTEDGGWRTDGNCVTEDGRRRTDGIGDGACETAAGPDRATGILTPAGDPHAMASAAGHLLADGRLRARLADNAHIDARARFDLDRQVEEYLAWYRQILDG